jgi:hypothetical protein
MISPVRHVVLVRLNWDNTAIPLRIRGFYTIRVDPEPGHPCGRKGLQLAAAWQTLSTPAAAGMVILDGDVAIDPHDLAAMLAAVELDPDVVHVGPVRLWPASTKLDRWIWGHGRGRFTRDDVDDVDMFGFSFTYLPRRLVLDCIEHGLASWAYPHVDERTRGRCHALRIGVKVLRNASPKHLNY